MECTCQESLSYEWGLEINCKELNLNDSSIDNVLQALLKSDVSPTVTFDASYNSLTKVPDDLSKLSKLTTIYMFRNQITSIPSGAFQSDSTNQIGIYLAYNQISSLSPGAFNYPYARIGLDLGNNFIMDIPDGVFEGNVLYRILT